jgi:hypothetical protein
MKNNKLISWSFVHSVGVLAYTALVVLIMNNGEKLFGKQMNYLGALAMLLLFVISATIVGALVLGKPVLLYLDGQKKDAIKLLFMTIGWLLIFTIIAFIVLLLVR